MEIPPVSKALDTLKTRRSLDVGGTSYAYYSLPAAEGGAISDPDYLARLDAFAEWYRAQPGVDAAGTQHQCSAW